MSAKLAFENRFHRMACNDFLDDLRAAESDDLRHEHWMLACDELHDFHEGHWIEEILHLIDIIVLPIRQRIVSFHDSLREQFHRLFENCVHRLIDHIRSSEVYHYIVMGRKLLLLLRL